MNKRYTLVVSSCDSYEDLWIPFFTVLKNEWDGLDKIPIVLNTESKSFSFEELDIVTMNLYGAGDTVPWTKRLRETLERINTDYILFLLDDFFMDGRVKSELIDKHVNWLDNNPDVSMFCYKETFASKNIRDGRFEGFERRPLIGEYKFNCQAALWRRNRLISYLKKDETPWEWETLGNWRSYRHPFHKFYSAIPGEEHVFPYICEINGEPIGGAGVYQGRWCSSYVDSIFRRNGIEIDYSIRGEVTTDELVNPIDSQMNMNNTTSRNKPLLIMPIYNIISAVKTIIYIGKNIRHF